MHHRASAHWARPSIWLGQAIIIAIGIAACTEAPAVAKVETWRQEGPTPER